MKTSDLWEKSKHLKMQVSGDIAQGFSLGFDDRIPEQTRNALISFAYWVEDNYAMPITLWVDFKYNTYLLNRERKRVGYRFWCVDFKTYPYFDNPDDIPVIELPVRSKDAEKILLFFIEAITRYFAWMANESFADDPDFKKSVLERYLRQTKC